MRFLLDRHDIDQVYISASHSSQVLSDHIIFLKMWYNNNTDEQPFILTEHHGKEWLPDDTGGQD